MSSHMILPEVLTNATTRMLLQDWLIVVVEAEAGHIIVTHAPTRIFGTGALVSTALMDFADTFIRIYRSYLDTPPHQLTTQAIAFREQLKGMVKQVYDVE